MESSTEARKLYPFPPIGTPPGDIPALQAMPVERFYRFLPQSIRPDQVNHGQFFGGKKSRAFPPSSVNGTVWAMSRRGCTISLDTTTRPAYIYTKMAQAKKAGQATPDSVALA